MNYVLPVVITLLVVALGYVVFQQLSVRKARRYAVTLKRNEGAFVGLRVERHWNHWVFEDIKLPARPGTHTAEVAPGRLHVPTKNILYYQELANVVE